MRDAVVVEAVRSPIGRGRASGSLAPVHPIDLLAHSISAAVERSGVDPALIDDVIAGCVTQSGEQAANIARWATLAAGLPESVPGTTVDRQCGSSQQAVHFAAQGVIAGAYDMVLACGVESMGRVPMGSATLPGDSHGTRINARYPDGLISQGISAELIGARRGLGRAEMDEFALASHQRAAAAARDGLFAPEIAPVKVTGPDGSVVEFSADEGIRPASSTQALAGLRPAFYDEATAARFPEIGWNVTAGNASQISDGSAALLITTSERARELGLRPLARLHSFAVVGDDPFLMLRGVIPATRRVLERSGLSLDDIDLFEVNEAFAAVVLDWRAEIGAPADKVNARGGAIALGHPLGASGARIMTTLVHALHQTGGRFGLQTMCEAGGLANATIIERL
ncbi:acetyl-CoA acetyltransferase [Parafrankia soli]|uniref:Acetyl-CoA acetyltransferase n=1 Tax=Parafrankia soli TaxID=2599596 RepID=A0A1S1PMD5_9ACTN|nr:thiolase family protein [Parafrankia soli]OHV22850.1 acetyl-CoA acetyltransferase [Parafrankia soli]